MCQQHLLRSLFLSQVPKSVPTLFRRIPKEAKEAAAFTDSGPQNSNLGLSIEITNGVKAGR